MVASIQEYDQKNGKESEPEPEPEDETEGPADDAVSIQEEPEGPSDVYEQAENDDFLHEENFSDEDL
jgi:hypothetical protein